jgi:hypothetical protein
LPAKSTRRVRQAGSANDSFFCEGGEAVHDPQDLTDRQIVGHLLTSHPEGPSLFGEAGHRHALAKRSAAAVAEAFAVMQSARLGYEELQHRLDPRRTRALHLGLALVLLALIVACLAVLDDIAFSDVLAGWAVLAAAAAAAATWAGWAWLAALARNEEQRGRLAAIVAAAASTGLLLAILHGAGSMSGRPRAWQAFGVGALLAMLILALVAAAAAVIARTEPASLLLARHRWHRSRRRYAAARSAQAADAEAAVIAGQGWRNLIDIQAGAPADGETPILTDRPVLSAAEHAQSLRPVYQNRAQHPTEEGGLHPQAISKGQQHGHRHHRDHHLSRGGHHRDHGRDNRRNPPRRAGILADRAGAGTAQPGRPAGHRPVRPGQE